MVLYALIGVVWGLIINQIAYLLVYEYASVSLGSHCFTCHIPFLWYQRIPLLSYSVMAGRCPHCHAFLSVYNEVTVLLAACCLSGFSCLIDSVYQVSYFIFFSALLVTFRTDIETMLISQAVTVYLIPLALFLSALRALPISLFESMVGAIFGYVLLYSIMRLFLWMTRIQGMGLGDVDLLAFIGAFTGPMGCWVALLFASLLGSLMGVLLLVLAKRDQKSPLPFGPFLALGALGYVMWQQEIVTCLFQTYL